MDYVQRLLAAAELVLASDRAAEGSHSLDAAALGITAELKPHQLEGVAWLIRRYELGVNVVLGDEMGLGKTLQALSLLSYLKKQSLSPGAFLVLCPLSVTDGWISEITRFCPTLRAIRYVGDKAHRRGLRRMMYEHIQNHSMSFDGNAELPFDVLLTTYDIAMLDQDFLSQVPWHYTVIDEAQRLKNFSSVLYNVLQQDYVMPRRLLMTGTPIQNDLSELWSLMHFCMPSIFGTLEQFISAFKEERKSFTGGDADFSDNSKRQYKTLRYILKAFMLRRTKALLIGSGNLLLPPLTEITMMVPLVPLQKKVYMSILRKELPTLLALSSGASNHQSLQNIVMQLRKACSHPYLFNGIEPEPYQEGEHLIQASGKLIVLDQLLQKLYTTGHRVLLFAQMTHTLDILQDYLELRKFSYERLDGSVRAEERFAAIRSFSSQLGTDDSRDQKKRDVAFVFMISTRAGGVGLNLVAADTVIFYEQDWNPQVDKQALQRAHRIGQMNHVMSVNLVTQCSIEEVIMRRAERKLQLSSNVVGEDDNKYGGGKDQDLVGGDMKALIFGLHTCDIADADTDDFSKEEMDKVSAMINKVLDVRNQNKGDKDDQKLEINTAHMLSPSDLKLRSYDYIKSEPELDEASYRCWVEKFKEESKSSESSILDTRKRRNNLDEKHPTTDAQARQKKAEEKKLAKWRDLGYQSLAVIDPQPLADSDNISDAGSVQFVYGDCTNPARVRPSEPAIIFSCVDTSGTWGHGGMFDAIANLSSSIPDAYQRASECGDLHMGDLFLIKVDESSHGDQSPLWVALAIVQSYNPRRKVPRNEISITDLETCMSKASFAAAENSASIHMPRIGYQDGSGRSAWYTVERLLRKYASIHGINIFVYYFRRVSEE